MVHREELELKIKELEKGLTGDMWTDMELEEEIRTIKRQLSVYENPVTELPDDWDIECFNCGS